MILSENDKREMCPQHGWWGGWSSSEIDTTSARTVEESALVDVEDAEVLEDVEGRPSARPQVPPRRPSRGSHFLRGGGALAVAPCLQEDVADPPDHANRARCWEGSSCESWGLTLRTGAPARGGLRACGAPVPVRRPAPQKP